METLFRLYADSLDRGLGVEDLIFKQSSLRNVYKKQVTVRFSGKSCQKLAKVYDAISVYSQT